MATIRVHVMPNAKMDEIVGPHGQAIKIKLRAPAIDGKANAALIRFLADQLGVSQRQIIIQRGQKSRDKLVSITGLSDEEARRGLRA